MSSNAFASPAYSRLDPSRGARPRGPAPKATKGQSAVEATMFVVFGLTIVLSLISLYVLNSPEHQLVPNRVAEGVSAGRVNLLVIATSKDGASVNTESLTLVSLRPQTHQAAMIAVPRDLWVHVGRYGSHRLASALNIGQSSGYPGEGPGLVTDTVAQVFGQPVHAFLRVDSGDLAKTIDALGGIELNVQKPFYALDATGIRFQFSPGLRRMDGRRAITFAQSEQVTGPEADRVAREHRQQQVVSAVFEKIARVTPAERLRLAVFAHGENAKSATNLTAAQIDNLCGTFTQVATVGHVTLEPLVDEFEVRSLLDGGQAVRPRSGDFVKVQALARDIFTTAQPLAAMH